MLTSYLARTGANSSDQPGIAGTGDRLSTGCGLESAKAVGDVTARRVGIEVQAVGNHHVNAALGDYRTARVPYRLRLDDDIAGSWNLSWGRIVSSILYG